MNIAFFLRPKVRTAFIEREDTVRQGLEVMRNHGYTALPVLDEGGVYIGTVSEGDFLWSILDREQATMKAQEALKVKDIMRPLWNKSVSIYAEASELLERTKNQNFVPVVDDRGVFVGIITRKDVIEYFEKAYIKEPVANVPIPTR